MHPINIVCPTCAAAVGRPCRNAWGIPTSTYHQTRIDAANAGSGKEWKPRRSR